MVVCVTCSRLCFKDVFNLESRILKHQNGLKLASRNETFWVVSIIFNFHPYLWMLPILTNILQYFSDVLKPPTMKPSFIFYGLVDCTEVCFFLKFRILGEQSFLKCNRKIYVVYIFCFSPVPMKRHPVVYMICFVN